MTDEQIRKLLDKEIETRAAALERYADELDGTETPLKRQLIRRKLYETAVMLRAIARPDGRE